MNIIRFAKCICCLIKCSKYLYFIKKIICVSVAVLTGAFIIGLFFDGNKVKKILKGKV